MIKSSNVDLLDINMFLDILYINNDSFTVVIKALWVNVQEWWRHVKEKQDIKSQRVKEEKIKRYETFVRRFNIKITLNIWIMTIIVECKGGMVLYATSLREAGPLILAPATPSSEGGVAGRDSYKKIEEEEGSDKSKLLHLYLNSSLGKFYLLFYLLFELMFYCCLCLFCIYSVTKLWVLQHSHWIYTK